MRGRVPVCVGDGEHVAARVVDVERRVPEAVRDLRSAAVDVVVVQNTVASGVDRRDQAAVDVVLVAGDSHAAGVGDVRQEMPVVVGEFRLVSADVRHRNEVLVGVVAVRDGVSGRSADPRNPILRVAFEHDGFSVRVRHVVLRERDDVAVCGVDALQPRDVVEDINGSVQCGQLILPGVVGPEIVIVNLALLNQQIRGLPQGLEFRFAAVCGHIIGLDPLERVHCLTGGVEPQREFVRFPVAPVNDDLMRFFFHQRIGLHPSGGHVQSPVAARYAVFGQRGLRQLHIPAVAEIAAFVFDAAVVGSGNRKGEAADRDIHVDEAHGEVADLQLSFHGDGQLAGDRAAGGCFQGKPNGVMAVRQQRRVEHAQNAVAHGLRALFEHGVFDRYAGRVVVVALLHRRAGERVFRHAAAGGGADDVRRCRYDGPVGRRGDGSCIRDCHRSPDGLRRKNIRPDGRISRLPESRNGGSFVRQSAERCLKNHDKNKHQCRKSSELIPHSLSSLFLGMQRDTSSERFR